MSTVKAVFMDYTGTIVQEECPAVQEVVMRFCRNSDVTSPKEMLSYWWKNLKEYEEKSYHDDFMTEDEIVDLLLEKCVRELHLKENLTELHELFQHFWMYSPVYGDVKEFFEKCPVPIYVLTNNGIRYLEEAMRVNSLHPAGIICGDMVRAYKPHRELFEKALEVSGCRADEVVHVGDSPSSDAKGAQAAGITPILIDRSGKKQAPGIRTVTSLLEILPCIRQEA